MTSIQINGVRYPAKVSGQKRDTAWDGRESKTIHLEMSHGEAMSVFTDDAPWSILYQPEGADSEGNPWPEEAYDNSAYCIAGPVTDNRDGTVDVKMGKPTAAELLAVLMGGNV